ERRLPVALGVDGYALGPSGQPLRDLVLREGEIAIELGRQHLVARARDAEADFAVRGRERLNEPCRIRGARSAGYAEENAHVRTLLGPFGGLEENRELAQVCVAEGREGRHRRAFVDAAGALEMCNLEGDAFVLRPLGTQVRCSELRAADTEVGVAVEAAGGREELGAGNRLRRQLLRLHPIRNVRQELGPERLLRRGALVG